MRMAVYPFASTGCVEDNLTKIKNAMAMAAEHGVRLLAFHECALCGYPPTEIAFDAVDHEAIRRALEKIGVLAETYCLNTAVGTIRREGERCFNSMVLFGADGSVRGCYDKQALWGWDEENFARGTQSGVFEVDGLRVGFRLCFDVRFPELFRQLYREKADACVVSFSDAQPVPALERYEIIRAHLLTRAMENVMPVISVNTLSGCSTAPTAVFDRNGRTVEELAPGEERLLIYELEKSPLTFGEQGRMVNNGRFLPEV